MNMTAPVLVPITWYASRSQTTNYVGMRFPTQNGHLTLTQDIPIDNIEPSDHLSRSLFYKLRDGIA